MDGMIDSWIPEIARPDDDDDDDDDMKWIWIWIPSSPRHWSPTGIDPPQGPSPYPLSFCYPCDTFLIGKMFRFLRAVSVKTAHSISREK